MATIIAPNRNYTGNQGTIGFVNGIATYVSFEDKEKEAMVFEILRKRGFSIISDEEYANKMSGALKEGAKAGKPISPSLSGDDLLPPVDEEDDEYDDMGGDNGDVDDDTDEVSTHGKATTTIKRSKGKASK